MNAKDHTPETTKHERPLISKESIEANYRDIKFIAIHCAATKPSMVVPISRIREWHLARGFKDVGYHFYIRRDGVVEYGRPISDIGAHVKGFNSVSIGVCYEGGINENGDAEDNRTTEQLKTMTRLIKELNTVYSEAIIKGHRDFPNVSKACPSFDVAKWLETI